MRIPAFPNRASVDWVRVYELQTDPSANPPANITPMISGTAQVGSTLTATLAEKVPDATYKWLRGGEEIAEAASASYAPAAADVGSRLSVRVERGGRNAESAETIPVWPAPQSPSLGEDEEEWLGTTMTLGSSVALAAWGAGYLRFPIASFGELDATEFDLDGVRYAVRMFMVVGDGAFGFSTEPALPSTDGLRVFWDGYRVTVFETDTVDGIALWMSRTPQPAKEYYRYWDDASSDGVRVAVSVRREMPDPEVTEDDVAVTARFQPDGTCQRF